MSISRRFGGAGIRRFGRRDRPDRWAWARSVTGVANAHFSGAPGTQVLNGSGELIEIRDYIADAYTLDAPNGALAPQAGGWRSQISPARYLEGNGSWAPIGTAPFSVVWYQDVLAPLGTNGIGAWAAGGADRVLAGLESGGSYRGQRRASGTISNVDAGVVSTGQQSIALTYDGTTLSLYLSGALLGSIASVDSIAASTKELWGARTLDGASVSDLTNAVLYGRVAATAAWSAAEVAQIHARLAAIYG